MPFPRPGENSLQADESTDFELAELPAVSLDTRDAIGEVVYVGKAVMKAMWLEG